MKTLSELGYEILPLSKLVKAKWNYKEDDQKKLEKLKANIKRNKQIENLIVREAGKKYEIVNGNHRYDALEQLGIKFAVVNNLGKITTKQAKRIAIETNETRFATDTIKLSELVKEIATDFSLDDLTTSMPYTRDEIEELTKLVDFDWTQFEKQKDITGDVPKFVIRFDSEKQKQEFLRCWNEHGGDNRSEGEIMLELVKTSLKT